VWDVGTSVERNVAGGQSRFELCHQFQQYRWRPASAQMGNLVMSPAIRSVEQYFKPWHHDILGGIEQFRQPIRVNLTDENQSEMQGVRARATAIAKFVQFPGGGIEGGSDWRIRPEREKHPHTLHIHPRAIRQTASAAIPSPRPVKPNVSVVVAFTFT